ncbi:hypothetical protein FAM09_26030 [Niastella caeni]|uniref:Uncharacterized protein n=1 Tax=Niastella caeni TaxID=2569763 RepID=A0A4S8HJA1_9BACT|nr:hypothetical protein [Niastella caeni]THU32912.1 hypothetical protein FAM09_26030 [Niastella caeni]
MTFLPLKITTTVRRWPPDLTTPPPDPRDQCKLRHRRNKDPKLAIIKPGRFVRYHRTKAKPAPPKVKPRKAKLPNGKYFEKIKLERLEKDKPDKRKLRGAKKKEALRLYKLNNPKGILRASKPAPDYRGIIKPCDLEKFMHLTPRNARRVHSKILKLLGKEKHHLLTVGEFCKHKNIPKEEIIPYLR